MTQQIIIEETFGHWPCRISIEPAGLGITFKGSTQFMYWEELVDVEMLAEEFGYIPVRVFAPMVKKLGEIYAQRETWYSCLQT